MELTKCKLGELITQRREKNDGSDLPICGVSKDGLIPPKQKDADTSIYNVFYRDDFIFNPARMELNSIAINDMYDRAICSSLYEVFYVHRTDLLLPHYLKLIIRQKWFTRYCEFLGQGSAREYCRFGNISEIEIEFPPIKEQQKIVDYNTAIENRIALKQKINDNLRASASIMFFNKIRYVQCSECCQETEIGRYPIEWTFSTLGNVLDTIIDRRGLTPTKLGSEWSNEGIIALSAKSVKNHELVNLDIANHVDNDLYNRWMPQKLQSQDILMTSEAPLGEFYYLADFSTYCLSQRLFAMRANKTIIEPTVLYFQLTDSIGKHQIDIRKTGTTVTGIRQSELIQVPIIVPPMNIQKEFARFCNPIMITIEKNADEIRQLFKLQEMLLSRLSR